MKENGGSEYPDIKATPLTPGDIQRVRYIILMFHDANEYRNFIDELAEHGPSVMSLGPHVENIMARVEMDKASERRRQVFREMTAWSGWAFGGITLLLVMLNSYWDELAMLRALLTGGAE